VKVYYEDERLAALHNKVAKAMYYASCGTPTALWEADDDNRDMPVISDGLRGYWRLLAYAALEAIRREIQ
jgi:hypothetical protein